MIELDVVEPVEEVDDARNGGVHAHAHIVGELRVGACREGRQLFVARLDELDPIADLVEGARQRVGAVAGVVIDAFYSPLAQALQHELRHVLSFAFNPEEACGGCRVSCEMQELPPKSAYAAFFTAG